MPVPEPLRALRAWLRAHRAGGGISIVAGVPARPTCRR